MPAPAKHRKSIVDAAVTLFRRQGYSGTGLSDIIATSGAPKGSLYHYYPDGKASIAAESVREAGQRVADTVRELAGRSESAGDLLIAHARLLAGWMEKSGFRDGCPITTVLLEMAPDDPGITEAGRLSYEARLTAMAEKFAADGLDAAKAGRLAVLCTAALQGALIQSRVERSGAPILIAAEELAALLPNSNSGG